VRRGADQGIAAFQPFLDALGLLAHNVAQSHPFARCRLRASAEIGDVGRWLCLPGDLVKAKWVGRQHHQHQHQHRHAAAASIHGSRMVPETPSRAARANAAFRQDRETWAKGCLQRGAWPPSAALPASAHGCESLQNSRCARRWPSGDAAAGLLSIAIAVAVRAATDGEGDPRTSVRPGEHLD